MWRLLHSAADQQPMAPIHADRPEAAMAVPGHTDSRVWLRRGSMGALLVCDEDLHSEADCS
jgi:hypothetical protein